LLSGARRAPAATACFAWTIRDVSIRLARTVQPMTQLVKLMADRHGLDERKANLDGVKGLLGPHSNKVNPMLGPKTASVWHLRGICHVFLLGYAETMQCIDKMGFASGPVRRLALHGDVDIDAATLRYAFQTRTSSGQNKERRMERATHDFPMETRSARDCDFFWYRGCDSRCQWRVRRRAGR
jgi:hypothetical protein